MDVVLKFIESTIKNEIDTGLLSYSMYTVENRAIPSAIDGFKPSGRKLVYAMLTDNKSKRVKVAELGGSLAKYNFHHGETSAMSATVTLAADWNNTVPVFTGHGNFGSRLVQEAAAPRYIFVSMSDQFKKFFIDEEVCPVNADKDNPEPGHYLPIIPWVLLNGISGIAVGFASDILPRSVESLVDATRKCIKGPTKFLADSVPIPPVFPHFKGIVAPESDTGLQWSTTGIINYVGKYTYEISELPIGYDREKYVTLLNKLEAEDKIKDYEDSCSDQGFGFSIKVTGAQKSLIDKDPIGYFKLKKLHSENLTTLGHDGKLKIFKSVPDLIYYFVTYRTTKFSDKIEYDKKKLIDEIEYLKDKTKFISDIVDDEIVLRKSTKAEVLDYIYKWITTKDYGKTFVNIPIYACTTDEVEKLHDIITSKEEELVKLNSVTPEKLFLDNLKKV